MRKPSIGKQVVVWITLMVFILGPAFPVSQASAVTAIDPALVRAAAVTVELDSLAEMPVPVPDLGEFLKSDPSATDMAIRLGKSLFWDMQVGSDGQACGSCHFSAGADIRIRNQISPAVKAGDGHFGSSSFTQFRPDYTLKPSDFPLHKLEDPEQLSYTQRIVVADTNDVVSSQGIFPSIFAGLAFGQPGDLGTPFVDEAFNILTPFAVATTDNTRRVEPRNTPTMINAIFNFMNFWDGRAHNQFNGVNPIGPLDANAKIWVVSGGTPTQVQISIPNASLASLSTGPPLSNFEMSFFKRSFPQLGRKMLSNGLTPLGLQAVHPNDSVFGTGSALGSVISVNGIGLNTTYAQMIRDTFQEKYWDSAETIDGYTLMEANFSLFYGLALNMYMATLVSDDTPFDAFMEGDDTTLTQEQLQGLLVFINSGRRNINSAETITALAQANAALGITLGAGNCINCHGSAVFTDANVEEVSAGPIEVERTAGLTADGRLVRLPATAFVDNGFANIGVRPSSEDLGRGEGVGQGFPFPLSFGRQMVAGLSFAFPRPECGTPATDPCPTADRVSADGNFKIPGLRNVELTGPYFHNGGQLSLEQVLEFYNRQGDFGDVNVDTVERNLAFVDLFDTDEPALEAFLIALTDERVRYEQAPFDHPQVLIPNGGTFGNEQPRIEVPAVGADGRALDNPLLAFDEQFVMADIEVTPASVDLGDVKLGSEKTRTIIVKNAGSDALDIGQITLDAAAGYSFALVNDHCSNQSVAPDASCTLQVEFEPVMIGVKYATVSIPSNDSDTPSVEVAFAAVAIPADMDVIAPALTMDYMDGTTHQRDKTICGTIEAGIIPAVTCNSGKVDPVRINGNTWCAQITGLAAGNNNITVTATDPAGNVTTKTAAMTVVVPDGCFSGAGQATVSDALKALRIAVGIVPATNDDMLHGDVAPQGAPNNKIDTADALLILKKSVGVMNF